MTLTSHSGVQWLSKSLEPTHQHQHHPITHTFYEFFITGYIERKLFVMSLWCSRESSWWCKTWPPPHLWPLGIAKDRLGFVVEVVLSWFHPYPPDKTTERFLNFTLWISITTIGVLTYSTPQTLFIKWTMFELKKKEDYIKYMSMPTLLSEFFRKNIHGDLFTQCMIMIF